MASTYSRASGTPSPACSLSCRACACRCSIWSRTIPPNVSQRGSGEPDASACSAARITGPTSSPAGLSPVNGAPSPARCTRTTVSKSHWSATSRASGPRARALGKIERLLHLLFALHPHTGENQVYLALLKSLARDGDHWAIERITVRRHPATSFSLHQG